NQNGWRRCAENCRSPEHAKERVCRCLGNSSCLSVAQASCLWRSRASRLANLELVRQARCPPAPQPRRPCYCKPLASCCPRTAQHESLAIVTSNGIHVSKLLPDALIADRNSFR